jgi:hypothetical protein
MWLHEWGYIILLFLSSFVTYHQVCNKSNTISGTCGGGPATLPEFILGFYLCSSYPIFSFLCSSLFVLFVLSIVLSVIRLTTSDYLFGIFKLFFIEKRVDIFHACVINLITLSKPSTQILTKAISNIVKLYVMQVFSIKVIASYRCCERMISFKPSPEWEIITTTAMHIKLTRNKNICLWQIDIKSVRICGRHVVKITQKCIGKIATYKTHFHDCSLSRLCTRTLAKRGGLKRKINQADVIIQLSL